MNTTITRRAAKIQPASGELVITKADRRANAGGGWVKGVVNGHRFEALIFDDHAENPDYEIGQSYISKLWVERQADGAMVYSWDRGLEAAPKTPAAAEVVDLLCDRLAEAARGGVTKNANTTDGLFTEIAQRVLMVETLETRGRDSLDFYDVSVSAIKRALAEAYAAGRASRK